MIGEVYRNHTLKYPTTICLCNVCFFGVPPSSKFFFSFLFINIMLSDLKELAHADLKERNTFGMNFYCLGYDFFSSINFCFGTFEIRHYKTKWCLRMVSEIFHVVASDQYAERKFVTQHLALCPSPSMISKRQLASSTLVRYTLHD